jgi:hypothetical protein
MLAYSGDGRKTPIGHSEYEVLSEPVPEPGDEAVALSVHALPELL